jgi:hypothetical protein
LFYFFFASVFASIFTSASTALALLVLAAKYLVITTLAALRVFQYCAVRQNHDDYE